MMRERIRKDSIVVDAEAAEQEGAEEEVTEKQPLKRSELEDQVLKTSLELESDGRIMIPALGWDGTMEGEAEAVDCIGFLFTM